MLEYKPLSGIANNFLLECSLLMLLLMRITRRKADFGIDGDGIYLLNELDSKITCLMTHETA